MSGFVDLVSLVSLPTGGLHVQTKEHKRARTSRASEARKQKAPQWAGLSHWKYLDQLEYERPILNRLRGQISGIRHHLNGIDLAEHGRGDKRLSV
jgi:hypothetical protein